MTEFRTTEQIAADFNRMAASHRLAPFTQVTDLDHLQYLLTDDPIFEQALHVSGAGPVFYDLGVLSGPEWEGVRQFLDSRLVSTTARGQLEQLRQDLQAADTDGDRLLNNHELVTYAQIHTDRWPNVAQFRSTADLLLNRLPGYLAQPNLNEEQLSRLYGIMNLMASEYDSLGVATESRGTVYGLSLQGFPSQDARNPPDLIRRARACQLTTEEIAAVHHILEAQITDGSWQFQNGAPLRPEELRVLGPMLELAAADGQTLHGMRLVTGEAETRLFAESDQAARRCLDGVSTALRGSDEEKARAFQACINDMSRIEGRNPDSLGVSTLIARATTGQLSHAETALLRSWMDSHGALYHMARTLSNMVSDPIHLIARNAAFLGGSWLYRRLLLQNAFESRLNKLCGGSVDNPRAAYRQYESWLTSRMANAPRWQRFLNYWARGSHTGGRIRQFFANFPVTFLHLAAFNVAAGFKDTNSLPVDIATDLLFLVPLFNGFETYDAFSRSGIQNFVQANPGVCQAEPATAEAPAPERVTAPATAAAPETAAETQAQKDAPTFEETRINTMPLPDVARGILAFQGQPPASDTASIRASSPSRAPAVSGVTAPGFSPVPVIPVPVPIPAPAVVPAPVVVPRFVPVAP